MFHRNAPQTSPRRISRFSQVFGASVVTISRMNLLWPWQYGNASLWEWQPWLSETGIMLYTDCSDEHCNLLGCEALALIWRKPICRFNRSNRSNTFNQGFAEFFAVDEAPPKCRPWQSFSAPWPWFLRYPWDTNLNIEWVCLMGYSWDIHGELMIDQWLECFSQLRYCTV